MTEKRYKVPKFRETSDEELSGEDRAEIRNRRKKLNKKRRSRNIPKEEW